MSRIIFIDIAYKFANESLKTPLDIRGPPDRIKELCSLILNENKNTDYSKTISLRILKKILSIFQRNDFLCFFYQSIRRYL